MLVDLAGAYKMLNSIIFKKINEYIRYVELDMIKEKSLRCLSLQDNCILSNFLFLHIVK